MGTRPFGILYQAIMQPFLNTFRKDPAWCSFLAFAFLSMVSMPLARIAMVVSLAFAALGADRKSRFSLSAPALGWMCYFLLALAVSSVAAACLDDALLTPAKGLGKTPKLLWFAAIILTTSLVSSKERFSQAVKALCLGGAAFAAYILVSSPCIAYLQVAYPVPCELGARPAGLAGILHGIFSALGLHEWLADALQSETWAPWGGRPPSFHYAISSLGTMNDAQRLMVALIGLVSVASAKESGNRRKRMLHAAATALVAMALTVTCKRGPLIIGLAVSGFILARRHSLWKTLLFALLAASMALCVPTLRIRLAQMPKELSPESGGRVLMWTRIVPQIHREHPWGIGFRSLTPKKMRSIDRRVEPNRNHVHNTALQAFVDFGYPGVAAWLLWMALSLFPAMELARKLALPEAAFPLCALAALFAFSFLEYNIADASVVIIYSVAMGLGAFRPGMLQEIHQN